MEAIGYIIIQIFILLLAAKLLGSIFERLKMPSLIGEILAGVIFINLVLFFPDAGGLLHFDPNEFMHDESHFLHVMGELGVIFLLFMVGLETKFSDLMKVGKTALYVALLGIAMPLLGGFALMLAYDPNNVNLALLVGTAMFAMSTGIAIEVLRGLNAMSSREAKIIIGAAVIDDILCLSLLAMISGIVAPGTDMTSIAVNTIIVVVFLVFAFGLISRIRKMADRRKHRMIERYKHADLHGEIAIGSSVSEFHEIRSHPSELSVLGLAVLVCLGMAALSTTVGLAGIIGAFLAGMLFAEFKDTVPCEENFNTVTSFMLPFFFIYVGMMVKFDAFELGLLPLLVALIAVAVFTKFISGYLGARKGKLSKDSSTLIGVSMIPRGEVGIIVASIGLTLGVFSDQMFTSIILMTLATTMIAPPLISWAYKRMYKHTHEDHSASPHK
ncbi:MAG: cation:proton antiporter [Candidatus Methanoplasma sp.]|jgi:Kef-type K+ transport system membrane component KefB|nr:cation:proton antiporter [Candidatus Methanoplasma sp.]